MQINSKLAIIKDTIKQNNTFINKCFNSIKKVNM